MPTLEQLYERLCLARRDLKKRAATFGAMLDEGRYSEEQLDYMAERCKMLREIRDEYLRDYDAVNGGKLPGVNGEWFDPC